MEHFNSWSLLVLVWLWVGVVRAESIFAFNFHRWFYQTSLVVGSRLYIDGGEAQDDVDGKALATTVVIDLSTDWTNDSIPVTYIDKPSDFPLARKPFIWSNSKQDTVYAFGGATYYVEEVTDSTYFSTVDSTGVTPPMPVPDDHSSYHYPIQTIWNLQLDGNGGGQWTKGVDPASSSGIEPTVGSSQVMAGDTVVFAGGLVTQPDFTTSSTPAFAVPGVLTASIDDASSWSNSSTSGFDIGTNGHSPWLAWGQAVYSPLFGSKGIVAYFGGYSPGDQVVGSLQNSENGALWDMSDIVILDVASNSWVQQTATGDVPLGRHSFCAVAVSDTAGSSVDIFIHGGQVTDGSGDPFQEDLSNIFVLTLPSFVWTRVPASSTNVNRANHACAVIGQRQMAVIGGSPYGATDNTDPWPNGIGVFDMSALSWSSSYSASAAPYERHPILSAVSEKFPGPDSWDSPKAQTVFATPQAQSDNTNSESSSSNNGAIIGGAVGGGVGLLVILAAVILFWRTRRRRQTQQFVSHFAPPPSYRGPSELEASSQPYEKSTGTEAHEIGSSTTPTPYYWVDKPVI